MAVVLRNRLRFTISNLWMESPVSRPGKFRTVSLGSQESIILDHHSGHSSQPYIDLCCFLRHNPIQDSHRTVLHYGNGISGHDPAFKKASRGAGARGENPCTRRTKRSASTSCPRRGTRRVSVDVSAAPAFFSKVIGKNRPPHNAAQRRTRSLRR